MTLTELAGKTGISKSTLSRLESGQRRPSLELLLPLAKAHHLPLDELVGAPRVGDPRIRTRPRTRNGRLVYPLTEGSSGVAVWKVVIPPESDRKLRTHAGHEWLYVLSGELRLILGEHDLTLRLGPIGGTFALVAASGALVGIYEPQAGPQILLTVPEMIWELTFGMYLVAKGFTSPALRRGVQATSALRAPVAVPVPG